MDQPLSTLDPITPTTETTPAETTPAEAAPAEAAPTQATAAPAPAAEDSPAPSAAETPAEPEPDEVQRVAFAPVQEGPVGPALGNIQYLKDVNLEAGVELGNATLSVDQILKLGIGSIVELNQTVGEPVRLLINNSVYALGEVVVIGDKFGVRIAKLTPNGNGGAA